jgi:hypothetical protein
MQTPSVVLNIGADVAKDAIVVACSEGSFPVREVERGRPGAEARRIQGLLQRVSRPPLARWHDVRATRRRIHTCSRLA